MAVELEEASTPLLRLPPSMGAIGGERRGPPAACACTAEEACDGGSDSVPERVTLISPITGCSLRRSPNP